MNSKLKILILIVLAVFAFFGTVNAFSTVSLMQSVSTAQLIIFQNTMATCYHDHTAFCESEDIPICIVFTPNKDGTYTRTPEIYHCFCSVCLKHFDVVR